MKRCRQSGNGGADATGVPSSGTEEGDDEDDDDDDEEDEENGEAPSSWSRDQASLRPKLLPNLRFHDLVSGTALLAGSSLVMVV